MTWSGSAYRAITGGWSAVTFDESKPFTFTNGLFAPGETITTVTHNPNGQIDQSSSTVTWTQWTKLLYLASAIDLMLGTDAEGRLLDNLRKSQLGEHGGPSIDPTAIPIPAPAAGTAGDGQSLSKDAKRKLGNLTSRAEENAADVIRSRGGSGSNVNQAGHWAEKTLAETAEAAAGGDASANTAIKIVSGSARSKALTHNWEVGVWTWMIKA